VADEEVSGRTATQGRVGGPPCGGLDEPTRLRHSSFVVNCHETPRNQSGDGKAAHLTTMSYDELSSWTTKKLLWGNKGGSSLRAPVMGACLAASAGVAVPGVAKVAQRSNVGRAVWNESGVGRGVWGRVRTPRRRACSTSAIRRGVWANKQTRSRRRWRAALRGPSQPIRMSGYCLPKRSLQFAHS